jgi:uncharacterized protein YggE
MFAIDRPQEALDEARVQAIATARARADLYARSLGMRVGRVLLVSEAGANMPSPVMMRMQAQDSAASNVAPGEQALSVSLTVSFELVQ